jgi:hypothetical protein
LLGFWPAGLYCMSVLDGPLLLCIRTCIHGILCMCMHPLPFPSSVVLSSSRKWAQLGASLLESPVSIPEDPRRSRTQRTRATFLPKLRNLLPVDHDGWLFVMSKRIAIFYRKVRVVVSRLHLPWAVSYVVFGSMSK